MQEGGGEREGSKLGWVRGGSETPNASKAKICSMRRKALKEKRANPFLDMTNHSRVGAGFPGDMGTAGEARSPHIPLHFLYGGGEVKDSPLGAAQVTEISRLYKLHISSCEK